ncbi:MAG TPA: DUF167 domain-containing protein [Pseudonocardiaceae bacterium]|nr:DUF167 domain-containing protein [Pseudonocardiaceae bacterium]
MSVVPRSSTAAPRPLRFPVRVRPGARRTAVGGRWDGPGGPALLVTVAAPAVEGKANAAVTEAIADAFGVRRSRVAIVAGHRGRDKLVELESPPPHARERLGELLDGGNRS